MVNPIYPTRSFIRFQAKSQLTADMSGQQVMTFVSREDVDSRMDLALPDASQKAPTNSELKCGQGNDSPAEIGVDEVLLKEISSLAFHPDQHPEIYQPCTSREQAAAIEKSIVAEIVDTYKRIKSNEARPSIQALNALL